MAGVRGGCCGGRAGTRVARRRRGGAFDGRTFDRDGGGLAPRRVFVAAAGGPDDLHARVLRPAEAPRCIVRTKATESMGIAGRNVRALSWASAFCGVASRSAPRLLQLRSV